MDMQYSLSQLLEIADRGFKTLFSGFDFRGHAEILKIQQKGKYVYAEMVEYDSEGKISARVKGCIFDEKVYIKFLQETKIETISAMIGLKILFHGRFSFHKDYNFSIIIDELSVEYTLGHLQKKQDDIMAMLLQRGIADNNKQLQRGYPPYTIAVISAQGAAGLKDFISVIDQTDYQVQFVYYFCAMHGNHAIQGVHGQLEQIVADIADGKRIDAVAIMRGGGESSGIAWQNDAEIATHVCMMPIPVIVAIGHTQDRYILQDIAWYGAKTPTDAAYKIIALLELRDNALEIMFDAIVTASEEKYQLMREHIEQWNENVQKKLRRFVQTSRFHIDSRYTTIMAISPKKMLQSGYALLTQQGEYLNKKDIDALHTGDELEIQVYDQQFSVKIMGKK